jgi:signal transduction histidine kinase
MTGTGFDVAKITGTAVTRENGYIGGNGIRNMQSRADDLNAKLTLHSAINEGTTIQLSLQL